MSYHSARFASVQNKHIVSLLRLFEYYEKAGLLRQIKIDAKILPFPSCHGQVLILNHDIVSRVLDFQRTQNLFTVYTKKKTNL